MLITRSSFFRVGFDFLSGPLEIVFSLHKAFRRDAFQIDSSAFKIAREGGDLTLVLDSLRLMGEILDYHAKGEEAAVFPAVDNVAPLVVQSYLFDHRALDIMVNGLDAMRNASDPLAMARATAVLNSHLRIHLDKEDAYLYPILINRTTESEQASILGVMSQKVPSDKFPTLVQWLFPLLDFQDQVVVAKGWMTGMPPQFFATLKPFIKKSVPDNWVELTRQIPGL